MESLDPGRNIWGVDIPHLAAMDQLKGLRVTLQCPKCSGLQSVCVDNSLLAALQEKGGAERTCKSCKTTGLWKLLPYDAE